MRRLLPFWLGVCYRIDFQLRPISCGVGVWRSRQLGAWLAVLKKPQITCFFIILLLVQFGSIFVRGLACQVLTHMISVTILFNLLIVQVTRRHVDPFFNLFGCFVCGWFEMNATNDFLIISKHSLKVYQKK